MHGAAKTRKIDREARIRRERYFWRVVLNPKDKNPWGALCNDPPVTIPVTKRALSYEELIVAADRPIDFAVEFHKRWNQAATSYVDNRTAGKARRRIDGTWHATDDAADYLSTKPRSCCPVIFYEKPFLGIFLFWLMAGMDAPLKDFWFFAAETADEKDAPGLSHAPGLARVLSEIETGLTLGTWTSKEAKKRNRAKRQKPRRPGLLTAWEELDLAQRGKAGDIPARDEIIARHWRLVQRKCRHVSVADQADAIAVGMAALLKAWKALDPDHDRFVRFGTFAAQAVDWAIADFKEQRRRQVPVAQSINPNNPVADNMDTERAEKAMTNNSIETQATIAKRNLVAERLACLDTRERFIMEGRLGLNGWQPQEQQYLANLLGISVRHLRRIEDTAVGKLQQAVV
jgi:RNA polymerase sigma-E/F/G factor